MLVTLLHLHYKSMKFQWRSSTVVLQRLTHHSPHPPNTLGVCSMLVQPETWPLFSECHARLTNLSFGYVADSAQQVAMTPALAAHLPLASVHTSASRGRPGEGPKESLPSNCSCFKGGGSSCFDTRRFSKKSRKSISCPLRCNYDSMIDHSWPYSFIKGKHLLYKTK